MHPEVVRFSTCENPFLVALSVCGRIECPCAEALFTFRETPLDAEPDGGELSFHLRVEPLSWQEVEPPSRDAAVAELVREFLEDYPEREKEPLRNNAERKRAAAERIREHRFDREEVVTGTLASFREIAFGPEAIYSSAFISAIKMDDVEYLIDDLYCPNLDCDCRQVHLDFLIAVREDESTRELRLARGFTGSLSFDGRREVDKVYDGERGQAERVFAAWAAANESLVADLEWRYRKVKEIARRSLPKHSLAPSLVKRSVDRPAEEPVRVGRNAPCPCGSGKKFKKCCGQSLSLGED